MTTPQRLFTCLTHSHLLKSVAPFGLAQALFPPRFRRLITSRSPGGGAVTSSPRRTGVEDCRFPPFVVSSYLCGHRVVTGPVTGAAFPPSDIRRFQGQRVAPLHPPDSRYARVIPAFGRRKVVSSSSDSTSVQLYDANGNPAGGPTSVSIAANGQAQAVSNNCASANPTRCSAKITADQPLAVVIFEQGDAAPYSPSGSNAFRAGRRPTLCRWSKTSGAARP